MKKLHTAAVETIADLRLKQEHPELYRPVKTNINELDLQIGGIVFPSYVGIGGPAKVGKTAVAMHVANVLAVAGRGRVGYYMMEELMRQGAIRSLTRLTTMTSRRHIRDLTLTEENFQELERVAKMLENSDMYLEDALYNVDKIIAHAIENKFTVIVTDYLQLMEIMGAFDKESNRYELISRRFVQARNTHGLTTLCVYQLNDKGVAYGTRAVYKDADLVLEVEEVVDDNKVVQPGVLNINVLPSRQAEGNKTVRVAFDGAHSRISNPVNFEELLNYGD